ncbi:hypothetical protein [Wenyingzhuangia sp. 2_MG-2023]|uniref:hypothetical protein n=1 Tax=Wenyingzhuangia sp. 2_MG-2023 TaxID=3062639 RepID=UPI0026E25CF4|nr:hypothetical protein [Wenyingzhuangia sp. 2_MG-2023]MDO6739333.1 hypothetical protein [Wenyingzhuangia sp. 2_MG-2023]
MKIQSKIKLTNLNKNILIEILEKNNLKVTVQNGLKFQEIVKPNTPNGYYVLKPILSGEFYSNEWKIRMNSILYKSTLVSLACYIFFWVNGTEITVRFIISITVFIINYWINKNIIKNRIESLEFEFKKKSKKTIIEINTTH